MLGLSRILVVAVAFLSVLVVAPARAADEAPSGATAERIFDLRIEGGKVAGGRRVIKVMQGDAVRLRWTADTPVALHLHGYDLERRVEPAKVVEMIFKATITGRFSISIHGEANAAKGGHHHPLARLEVHPR